MKCPIIVQFSMEKEENERLFEYFSSVHNSAVFLCKFFKKNSDNNFLGERS
jgi:uncharacterized protein Yka (UPF0111/DUF47 family)